MVQPGRGGRSPIRPSPDAPAGETGRLWGHALQPDPERIRDGWEHRFAAVGARADEMIALYEELGFEVVADPVAGDALVEGCAVCYGESPEPVRSIYTRKRVGAAEPEPTGPRTSRETTRTGSS